MTEHYFSDHPETPSDRRVIRSTIRDVSMEFITDAGVFSKNFIDFGTRLLIESLQLEGKKTILDVGCGYGPIGLYTAKLFPHAKITLIDINERALTLAKENTVRNEVNNVEILRSNGFEELSGRTFDAVITNPPIRAGKKIVHRIFEHSFHHLNDNGELWVVIQKKQGAPSALQKLEHLYSTVNEVAKKKGYRIYRAVKHS